ncbi:hypothetical protein Avbf_01843 [Armadillidium vulgare]|nr:hypothetical protein Avbf_01843 [Armadillidium vulgare]
MTKKEIWLCKFIGLRRGGTEQISYPRKDFNIVTSSLITVGAICVPYLNITQTWKLNGEHTSIFVELFSIIGAFNFLLFNLSQKVFSSNLSSKWLVTLFYDKHDCVTRDFDWTVFLKRTFF